MDPVVHFEMPYENRDRMADFYGSAFGWRANKLGEEMGDYAVMTTTEMDPMTKFPAKPGQINGGFYKRTAPEQRPSVVIAVEDIHASMKKVVSAGGALFGGMKPGEPDDIPGVGLHMAFVDSEGNRVSMLQPYPMDKK